MTKKGFEVAPEPVTAPTPGSGRGFRESLAALGGFQKSPAGVSYYTLSVNRPLGRVLAAGANALSLTPNMVTLLSALCSAAAIAVLAFAGVSVSSGFVAGGLLVLSFALDSADGQLARIRRVSGNTGEFLDHILDCGVKVGLHLAVLIGWYRAGREGSVLLIPMLFLWSSVVFFFGGILIQKMREGGRSRRPASEAGTGVDPLRATLLLPIDFGVVAVSFFLWGWPPLSLAIYAVLAFAQTVYLVPYVIRWRRELA